MEVLRPEVDLDAWRRLASPCQLCALRCGVDRLAGERGLCGVGPQARYYNAFVHYGEEPELTPCFTIFFSGCNFRCAYCSDGEWVEDPGHGRLLEPGELAGRILLARSRLRSVELVGGLADVSMHGVAELVRHLPPELPVVLNSNGWLTTEALQLLPPLADLLLLDVKHAGDGCAAALCGRPIAGYLAQLEQTLRLASSTLRLGVWVRHLVLPGHLGCCTEPVLRWLAELAPGCFVNVMTQYRPLHRAVGHPQLGRRLTAGERRAVPAWLRGLALPLDLRLDGRRIDQVR